MGGPQRWQIRFFKRHPDDDPTESRPGKDFLLACPKKVGQKLFTIIDAVVHGPPPSFSGGGMWETMHGEMAGYYEARTRGPDGRLYRLFCFLEQPRPGLSHPTVIVLGGMSKRRDAAFTASDYASIRRLGDEYRARTPRSVETP
jgi:hypothetical protein